MGGRVVAVIPSRFASTRFPGKPLAMISGVPMIVRVAERARAALERVIVATDDERIRDTAERAGFEVVMTSPDCASGTDRVAEVVALAGLEDAALLVNVQGDEPLIDPADITALAEDTLAAAAPMGTLCRPLLDRRRFADPNLVKVVRARDGRALYFSRAPIPHVAGDDEAPLMHVGMYAYQPHIVRTLAATAPTPLERAERLEQLRALELGVPILVTMARSRSPSIAVDTPEDVARVERALAEVAS